MGSISYVHFFLIWQNATKLCLFWDIFYTLTCLTWATPWSHPFMTSPFPRRNLNGTPLSLDESNFTPFSKVPAGENMNWIYSQTSDHEQFGLRTNFPNAKRLRWHTVSWVTNTQAVKSRQKQITLDNFLVRQRPSGSEAESSGAKRQKKEKESPSKQ